MPGILLYRSKRAVIDALTAVLAGPPLIEVFYSLPAQPPYVCVYGGAAQMVQADDAAEAGVATVETDLIDVWIRVYAPGDDVRGTDAAVEAIAATIIAMFNATPYLAGAMTWSGPVVGDAGEPTVAAGPEPAVVSKLLLQIRTQGGL